MKQICILFITTILLALSPAYARALNVGPLPQDNLIENPWFRNSSNPAQTSLQGWVDDTPGNYCFSTSRKDNNNAPSPDNNISTQARWADGTGQGGTLKPGCIGGAGGPAGTLHQVVTVPTSHDTLTFDFWWVTGENIESNVHIYGSQNESGPWTLIWTPFITTSRGSYSFVHLGQKSYALEGAGYPYYKVEFNGAYPAGTSQGYKFTGVYFTTSQSSNPPPEHSPDYTDYLAFIRNFARNTTTIFDLNSLIYSIIY